MVTSMTFYPVFFDLRGKPVVVIGGGKVAVRKARGLIEAGADVTVISPELMEEIAVSWKRRRYRRGDLRGAVLAFTATDDRSVNAKVATEAKQLGIPINVADSKDECDFIVPARLRRGNVQIAVSTGGGSPKLAKQLRRQLESVLPDVRS